MIYLDVFNSLFETVLQRYVRKWELSYPEVQAAIKDLAAFYAARPTALREGAFPIPDFNDAALCCAYLHKFAAFHSVLVFEVMQRILVDQGALFQDLVGFKLCCLGGGPGSDAIGVLAALYDKFDDFGTDLTIVDIVESWRFSFKAVVNELGQLKHETLERISQRLKWKYVVANLLSPFSYQVNREIGSAKLITMVKFVSAAACDATEQMVRNIFTVMQRGSLLLFIDNAGGGFPALMHRISKEQGLVMKFQLQHFFYAKKEMQSYKFHYPSCCQTRVGVFLFQKPVKMLTSAYTQFLPKEMSVLNAMCPSPIENSNHNRERMLTPQNQNSTHAQSRKGNEELHRPLPFQNRDLNKGHTQSFPKSQLIADAQSRKSTEGLRKPLVLQNCDQNREPMSPKNQNIAVVPNNKIDQEQCRPFFLPIYDGPCAPVSSDTSSGQRELLDPDSTNCSCCIIC